VTFVNYTEGAEHRSVCLNDLWVFDKRESKREEFCSRYCERKYEMAVYGVTGGNDASPEE
jgi:hypothetical protein